jgi:hypothetical protein
MEVIKRKHDGPALGQQTQQLAHRAMAPKAFLDNRSALASATCQRREHDRQEPTLILAQRPQRNRVKRGEVRVEGVHHHAEREVTLELGRLTLEQQRAAILSAPARLRKQS